MPLLSCRQLTLSRDGRTLLDGLNLDLEAGSVTVLLGPNGAGKSTLLKCITGELDVAGEIRLFDRPSAHWQAEALARQLGVLPQSASLTFPFLCQEVVAMGRLPHSEPRAQRDRIVAAAMAHAGVDHLSDRLYPSLSGGERQRVQFARVLAQIWHSADDEPRPRLLLLDEPTSALDLKHQHQLLAMARAVAGSHTAVLAVLHDLNLAARYGDRLIMLERGRLIADGTPRQVLQAPLIERLYGYPARVINDPQGAHPIVL
ncbi:heme ABC transporter ATP-binding protein [Aeromonas diversa]|uniref:heme ABC transporter ATP-binding protein n=1 Tax=Aeromonas diversa TaxID=502790 RepID=UPI0039A1A8E6